MPPTNAHWPDRIIAQLFKYFVTKAIYPFQHLVFNTLYQPPICSPTRALFSGPSYSAEVGCRPLLSNTNIGDTDPGDHVGGTLQSGTGCSHGGSSFPYTTPCCCTSHSEIYEFKEWSVQWRDRYECAVNELMGWRCCVDSKGSMCTTSTIIRMLHTHHITLGRWQEVHQWQKLEVLATNDSGRWPEWHVSIFWRWHKSMNS